MRRTVVVVVLAVWLVSTAALAAPAPVSAPAQGSPTRVSMIHFMFAPASVTVPAGTTVTWTYDESASDPMPNCETVVFQMGGPVSCPGHSTTSADGLWDSGVHRADGFPFSYTFSEPGTYAYFCTVHGGSTPNNPLTSMNGQVVVTGVAPSTSGADASSQPAAGVATAAGAGSSSAGPSRSLAASGGELTGAATGAALLTLSLVLRRAPRRRRAPCGGVSCGSATRWGRSERRSPAP